MADLTGRGELGGNADLPHRISDGREIDLRTVGQWDTQLEVHLPALMDRQRLLWPLAWGGWRLVSPPEARPLMHIAPDLGEVAARAGRSGNAVTPNESGYTLGPSAGAPAAAAEWRSAREGSKRRSRPRMPHR